MRLTGNPGGAGHNWVKRRYIDPNPTGYKIIQEFTDIEYFDPDTGENIKQRVSLSRVFIPSKIKDNALLMRNDPTYILRLRQSGSAALVKAWLEGDWNIIDGAFFDNWDSEIIVKPLDLLSEIPKHALRFRSFDWGSAKPFSCGWWAVADGTWGGLPKGALLRYREWYGATGANKGLKMTADLVAQGIKKREEGEMITYGAADPSIFIRNGGPSIAESMLIEGIGWKKADNKRDAGWAQMRMLMGNVPLLTGPDGKPDLEGPRTEAMIFCLETCEDSIRTIPTLQHDEDKPEDLDTEAEDHAADDWRYGVMSRPWVKYAPVAKGSGLPKLPSETTFNDLLSKLTARRRQRELQDE